MVSDSNINTLLGFRYKRRFVAASGGNGERRLRHGKDGGDVDVVVPVGTQVWTDQARRVLLVDLDEPDRRALVARGGKGGRGNAQFASSTLQFPLLAEAGEAGESLSVRFELKLLADVGIIGQPNVGKSSLLAAVSAARPKIAEYPFTTLEPVLGMVERHSNSLVMIDIPGLLEGGHLGVGLGHEFLRHVGRTRLLVHVVDGSSDDPIGDYKLVNEELRLFGDDLIEKRQIIAVNKIDLDGVRGRIGELKSKFGARNGVPHFISAASGEGLDELLDSTFKILNELHQEDEAQPETASSQPLQVLRPRPRRPETVVRKEGGTFVVSAPTAVRIAAILDDSDWTARMQFYRYLRRLGVVGELEKAGIRSGDTVRVGKVELEWD